ncbi:MAG: hypothetical protein ACQER9_02560 [Nanobdellota archaeon]
MQGKLEKVVDSNINLGRFFFFSDIDQNKTIQGLRVFSDSPKITGIKYKSLAKILADQQKNFVHKHKKEGTFFKRSEYNDFLLENPAVDELGYVLYHFQNLLVPTHNYSRKNQSGNNRTLFLSPKDGMRDESDILGNSDFQRKDILKNSKGFPFHHCSDNLVYSFDRENKTYTDVWDGCISQKNNSTIINFTPRFVPERNIKLKLEGITKINKIVIEDKTEDNPYDDVIPINYELKIDPESENIKGILKVAGLIYSVEDSKIKNKAILNDDINDFTVRADINNYLNKRKIDLSSTIDAFTYDPGDFHLQTVGKKLLHLGPLYISD